MTISSECEVGPVSASWAGADGARTFTAPRWLDRQAAKSRTARRAIFLGRTLCPQVGDRVRFDPIGRVGKKVRKYAGLSCVVFGVQYDVPVGCADLLPFVHVEFEDGFRYHLTPWHFVND